MISLSWGLNGYPEMACIRQVLMRVGIGPGTAGGASTAIFFAPELGASW